MTYRSSIQYNAAPVQRNPEIGKHAPIYTFQQ